MEWYDSKII